MRTIIARLVLAGVSTLAALVVLEGAVRALWTDPNQAELEELLDKRGFLASALRHSENSDRIYELRPSTQGLAWDTWVETNSAGFRGPETSIAKDGRTRIAAVGDSVTFGNGLPPNTTFPYQLQERSRSACPELEVLNFAVGGYDVVQIVATVEEQVAPFEPDIVVWGFCLNDIAIASGNVEYFLRSTSFANSVFFRSHLLRYLYRGWNRRQVSEQLEARNDPEVFAEVYRDKIDRIDAEERDVREWMRQAETLGRPTNNFSSEPHVGRLRNRFRRLRSIAEAEDFTVVILIVPVLNFAQGVYDHEAAHRIVEHEALENGFEVVDPLEAFVARDAKAWRRDPGDKIHPNPEGHALLADHLHRHLQENHPSLCPSGIR